MWGNKMHSKVHLQLFNTSIFDSGSLSMTTMVLRQFHASGRYCVTIFENGRAYKNVEFDVDEKVEKMQLDIDLARTAPDHRRHPDCCCHEKAKKKCLAHSVSPKGYVLFHVSSGKGYSVKVADKEGKTVFDSARLESGDLFALSLLEPAAYVMTNTVDSASGEIHVSLSPEVAKSLKTLETCFIEVTPKKFEPSQVKLVSSQGLVFRMKTPGRIVIKKATPSPKETARPLTHWQNLQGAASLKQR